MKASLEYLAGFFDGEGCLQIGGRIPWRHLQMSVAQRMLEPLPEFQKRWGGSIYIVKEHLPTKQSFLWGAASGDVYACILDLLPYIRQKLPQFELARRFQEDASAHEKDGKELTQRACNLREKYKQELSNLKKGNHKKRG